MSIKSDKWIQAMSEKHEYYLFEILFGALISIILGFFSSGITFSRLTVNKPLTSSAP